MSYFEFENRDSRVSLDDKATLSTTNSDRESISSQNRTSLTYYDGDNEKCFEDLKFKERFSSDPFFRAKINSFLKES